MLRSKRYCCKPCNESRLASWHIVPCPITGIWYSGHTPPASSLSSCIGSLALTPNDGMPSIRRSEPVQCTRDDTRPSQSKWTLMSFAHVDMLRGMHSAPAWCDVRKTGVGRVFGGDTSCAPTAFCTIGQYRAQITGLNMSIRLNPRRSWRRCDGRSDAVHHLEAIPGEPKKRGCRASILNSEEEGAQRRVSDSVREKTPVPFFSRCSGRPAPLRRRRQYVSRGARRLAPRC